jgi:hypothetical protein
MRVVEASGHPGGQHNAAEHDDTRQAPFGPDLIDPAADAGGHRFGSRLRDTLAARHAGQLAHQEDERLADAQVVHSARKAGGKQAINFLGGELGDDWMLIRGYQNSSGPIGQLLVGNHGVVAMTSLNLDATVHCHGDTWRAEKVDHHSGKSLGEIHLADQAGRSPSTQLNQAADTLEQFLRSSGVQIAVQRVVWLSHTFSRLEGSHRPTVHIFASHYDLARWLKELPKILDRAGRRQIERLFTGHEQATGGDQSQ